MPEEGPRQAAQDGLADLMTVILVKVGRRFYKARVNPTKEQLRKGIQRQMKRGRLASAVRLSLQLRKKNPLLKSADRSSISKNISWLMHHPKELTAKTKKMRHKQAIAIALSVWRKASGTKR